MDREIRRQRLHPFRRAQRNTVPSALCWLLAAALAACAGGDRSSEDRATPPAEQPQPTAAATGAANDPCDLVSRAEAEQVLGAPPEVARPPGANNRYLASCEYSAMRGAHLGTLVVGVSLQNGRYGFNNMRRGQEERMRIEPVAGLGNDAFWVPDDYLRGIHVLLDTTYLSIGSGGSLRLELEQARQLALQAL